MRKITLLFAFLCASVMGWATQYCGEALASTVGATTGQTVEFTASKTGELETTFSITSATSTIVGLYEAVLQNNGGGVLAGDWNNNSGWTLEGNTLSKVVAWTTYPTGNLQLHLIVRRDNSGGDSDIMGRTFTDIEVSAACGGGGGGGAFDPSTIDWSSVAFISGSSQFKIYFTDANRPANYTTINVQTAPWADNNTGIYVTFPDGVSACSLIDKTGCWIEGAQVLMYLTAFVDEVTEVTITHASGTKTLYVYNASASSAEPTEIYDTNFALVSLGASATSDNGGTANNAIDNNDGSSWESTHGVDAVKLTIDLGQKRIFNTVQIRWEGAYGKAFTIDVSNDNDTWTTVKTVDEELSGFPHEQTLEFAKTTARYIRFNGTQRGTQWGYNMFSFRVLLPGVSVLTSIDLAAAAAIAQVDGAGVALTAQPKDQNSNNMEAEVSYEITPAAAGHMSGNTFIPDQVGAASIRAYNGEIYSPAVTVLAYTGSNVALEKDVEASGYDDVNNLFPSFAVDNNEGSLWSARVGETGDLRVYDAWIIVDLGNFYDINLIAIRWEGACSKHYHVDFSADKSAWRTAYNAGWNAIATHWEYLIGTAEDATKVRYVRVWSTEAVSQYGVKIMDLKVFGTEWVDSGDTEAPEMTSASLVSSTATSAVIAVAATDNVEVVRYHVVDATNNIDANYVASEGNITITGLTQLTSYNFTITAVDAANLESENSKQVAVTTPFDVTINLALNKTCEAGYVDGNPAEVAAKANDGDNGSAWVTYGDHAAALDWWVVDLGNVYNLTNITALWANDAYATNYMLQARVEAPTADDKANDAAWVTLANVSGVTAGEERSTDVSGVGRYVRFRATAHTGFFRLREFRVYASGVATVDTEAPVMSSASLVSNTDSHAIISVAATDNNGIASYHVVDAGNSIDATLAPVDGKITVTGLTQGTAYTFVIKAIDLFGNESDNSQSVEVTTTAHYTAPQAACAAPTWDAELVKAMYSPTYEADYTHQDWGSGTVATKDEFGRKYVTNGNGYFGADGFVLNCLMMEKLHYDIWIENDATIRFVPIWGGTEQGITKSLTGQEWNSIDIDLTAYTGITNWGNITQMKIDQAANLTFWVANAYFYREAAYVDTEAPTNVSASLAATGFYSVKITASAEDNSGAVNFSVMNGENEVATGVAATGVATTITVNGLTPGTAYNFNVIAKDEAGNEATPVAVAATTKVVPAPAPAPVTSGKVIVPVYSDALDGSLTGIQSGSWGETTVYEWLEIAPNDHVFYGQNFNYAGWHSWGSSIDATDMMFLHIDFYSTGMTQVSITPISPGHEGVANCTLTPNAWTSVDVPLSTYAANNIDWSDIYQFKFFNAVGGNEIMIDNVYFWQPKVATTPVSGGDAQTGGWATFSSPDKVAVPEGLTAYKAVYEKNGNEEILNLTDIGGVIPANAGVLLRGAADHLYTFSSTNADEPDLSDNMLVGCPYRTDVSSVAETNDIFCLRYSSLYSMTGFFLYTNQYVPAGKAYIALPKEPGNPNNGARRVRFVINNGQTATGIENAQGEKLQSTKVLINGQLYIRRGDVVYTIQGARIK